MRYGRGGNSTQRKENYRGVSLTGSSAKTVRERRDREILKALTGWKQSFPQKA